MLLVLNKLLMQYEVPFCVLLVLCSSQVLSLICRKLIGQQIVNGTEVLKWLREILICRNKFLLKNKVKISSF